MNGFFNWARIYLSLMTDFTLRLVIILALLISFMAKLLLAFLRSTSQTLPKPPLPMQKWYTKLAFDTAVTNKDTRVRFPIQSQIDPFSHQTSRKTKLFLKLHVIMVNFKLYQASLLTTMLDLRKPVYARVIQRKFEAI